MTGPTTSTQRHLGVDALRGFALLGIMIVNIEFIVQPIELGWSSYTSPADLFVRGVIKTVAETKIYPIFAMLFGYGFALQVDRSGDELGRRYRRRMLMLIAMGVMHGIVLFPGDILVLYGLVGLGAYRLRHASSSQLFTIAAAVYGVSTMFWILLGSVDGAADAPSSTPSLVDAVTNGSFVDVIVAQAPIWLFTFLILFAVQGPMVVASYCVGMAIGRTTWLSHPADHLDKSSRALRWFPLGIALAAVAAWLALGPWKLDTFGFAVGVVAAPLMAAGWIALVVRLPDAMQRLLQPSGRMSLTVYLLESVVAAFLAMGYGLGWVGNVGPAAGLALAVAIWAGLSVFAHVWMRSFRFGPLEWLLRSVSYGQRQPLRR